jgi:hypothetical protein
VDTAYIHPTGLDPIPSECICNPTGKHHTQPTLEGATSSSAHWYIEIHPHPTTKLNTIEGEQVIHLCLSGIEQNMN